MDPPSALLDALNKAVFGHSSLSATLSNKKSQVDSEANGKDGNIPCFKHFDKHI